MFINKPTILTFVVTGGVVVFPFEFKFYDETDIQVYHTVAGVDYNDADDILDPSDYNIDANVSNIGGSVTITKVVADGDVVTIARSIPAIRIAEYAKRGSFTAKVVNDDQDYQSYVIQDLVAISNLSIRSPISGGGISDEPIVFPSPFAQAYIRWDITGAFLENDTTVPDAVVQTFNERMHATGAGLTSESYAVEFVDGAGGSNEYVVIYTWDEGTQTMIATPQANVFSSKWFEFHASTFDPALYVTKAGDTMTGQLKGIAPVANEDLTRKDYVDTQRDTRVAKSGDTMTGQLKGIAPVANEDLTRKDYVDAGDDTRLNNADEDYVGQVAGLKLLKSNGDDIKNQVTAWVNFDGTEVDGSNHCTIRDSFNVDYVLRTATGWFDIYFLTAMDNVNYSVSGTSVDGANISASNSANSVDKITQASTRNLGNTLSNYTSNSLVVLGGKA